MYAPRPPATPRSTPASLIADARRERLLPGRLRRIARERRELGRERLLGVDHVHHGVDQRQVRERLREVAQVAARARVDLLGVQAEVARVGEPLLAQGE